MRIQESGVVRQSDAGRGEERRGEERSGEEGRGDGALVRSGDRNDCMGD
jgi:hypothetical protein